MQVVEQGCGDYIQQGKSEEVLVRFDEYNINTRANISDQSLSLSNNLQASSYYVDKLRVTNTSGTFTGYLVEPNKSVFGWAYNYSSYTGSVIAVLFLPGGLFHSVGKR